MVLADVNDLYIPSTTGDRTVIDMIFNACVRLLVWMADSFGVSYAALNVAIFCLIVPAIILGQAAAIIWLLCHPA